MDVIIDDDVYRIDGVKRDTQKMRLLLRFLARNESTTVTNKMLMKDIKAVDDEDIDANTVAAYLDIFKRLFITDKQPPFSSGIRFSVRVKQSEKRHFADPLSGLCAGRIAGGFGDSWIPLWGPVRAGSAHLCRVLRSESLSLSGL